MTQLGAIEPDPDLTRPDPRHFDHRRKPAVHVHQVVPRLQDRPLPIGWQPVVRVGCIGAEDQGLTGDQRCPLRRGEAEVELHARPTRVVHPVEQHPANLAILRGTLLQLVEAQVQVGSILLHPGIERQQRRVPIAVAQLLLQELAPQVLLQLVPVLPRLAAPQPAITEQAVDLAHHLPQRHRLTEDGCFLIRHASPGGDLNAGLRLEAVAEIGERYALERQRHLPRQPRVNDGRLSLVLLYGRDDPSLGRRRDLGERHPDKVFLHPHVAPHLGFDLLPIVPRHRRPASHDGSGIRIDKIQVILERCPRAGAGRLNPLAKRHSVLPQRSPCALGGEHHGRLGDRCARSLQGWREVGHPWCSVVPRHTGEEPRPWRVSRRTRIHHHGRSSEPSGSTVMPSQQH